MRRNLAGLLALGLLLCASCDGDDPDPDAGPGSEADAGEPPIPLEDYLRDNNVVTLELQDDGTEYGAAMTDTEGLARFYSPVHEGVFEMAVADVDMEMALAERQVQVAVGDENIAYLIQDPAGVYDPLLYTVPLPEGDMQVEVDATEVYVEQAGIEDYDPDGGGANPFSTMRDDSVGVARAPLIVGVAFSLGIRSLMQGIAVGAAISVFKNLVQGACNFVAPVYAERCALLGNLVQLAGQLYAGVFISGASAWELGATVLDNALNLTGYTCERAGGAMVGYVQDPTGTSAQDRYRELARKLNYLLYQMETDPQPGQPSWSEAEEMARSLIALRDVVRNRYFQIWNDNPSHAALGYGLGVASSATSGFFDNLSVEVQAAVLTRVTVREEVRAFLQIGAYDARYSLTHYRYVQADFDTFEFTAELSDQGKALNGLLAGCAFNFVQGALIEWSDGAMRREVELETREIVDAMIDVWGGSIDEIYEANWGEPIPMGTCTPDLFEPNGTWQQAVASPVPTDLTGGGVVELRDLSLCDPTGMTGNEEDWYAYYIAPIELNVQSRIVGDPSWRGQNERVCIEVWFYSEIYEIGGSPPDLLRSACGLVRDWPATSSFGVRRTIGERWSMLLVHVRPESGMSMQDIGYAVRFTP